MKMAISGGGPGAPQTTDSSGAPAGNVVAEIQQPPGILETRELIFDAEADGVAIGTGVPIAVANIATFNGFAAGLKRARLTYHAEENLVPMVGSVLATLNAGDLPTAASNLSIAAATQTPEAGTFNTDTAKRMISSTRPAIEWDLTGTDATIDAIYVAGVASSGTGAGAVLVSLEVW